MTHRCRRNSTIKIYYCSLRPTRCHVIPRKYVAELLRLISLSSRLRNLLLFNHFLHGRNLHDLSQRGKSANRFSTATLEILLPKIQVTYHWHFSKTAILSVLDLLLHLTSHNLLLALHGDLCTLVMSHVCHRCLSSVSAAANNTECEICRICVERCSLMHSILL